MVARPARMVGGGRPGGRRATTAGALVLLAALAGTFELALKHRFTAARCFAVTCAVAIAMGVAESLVALGLSVGMGLPLFHPAHRSLVTAVRMGGAPDARRRGRVAAALRGHPRDAAPRVDLLPLGLVGSGAGEGQSIRIRVSRDRAQSVRDALLAQTMGLRAR